MSICPHCGKPLRLSEVETKRLGEALGRLIYRLGQDLAALDALK